MIGSSLIRQLMYPDDLVLISHLSIGLSMLFSVCSKYDIEHDIKQGIVKCNVMMSYLLNQLRFAYHEPRTKW